MLTDLPPSSRRPQRTLEALEHVHPTERDEGDEPDLTQDFFPMHDPPPTYDPNKPTPTPTPTPKPDPKEKACVNQHCTPKDWGLFCVCLDTPGKRGLRDDRWFIQSDSPAIERKGGDPDVPKHDPKQDPPPGWKDPGKTPPKPNKCAHPTCTKLTPYTTLCTCPSSERRGLEENTWSFQWDSVEVSRHELDSRDERA